MVGMARIRLVQGKRNCTNGIISLLSSPLQKAQTFANCDPCASCISTPWRHIYPVVQSTVPGMADRHIEGLFLAWLGAWTLTHLDIQVCSSINQHLDHRFVPSSAGVHQRRHALHESKADAELPGYRAVTIPQASAPETTGPGRLLDLLLILSILCLLLAPPASHRPTGHRTPEGRGESGTFP